MDSPKDLLITGLRAYKILEISQVLSQAAVIQGLNVKTAEFTNEPLMFIETAHIRIGKEIYSPLVSKNKADVLVCFEPLLALDLAVDYLSPGGIILINTHSLLPFIDLLDRTISLFEQLTKKIIKLDIIEEAQEAGLVDRNNFVMLGALVGINVIPIDPVNIIKAIEQIMDPGDAKICVKAIEVGSKAISSHIL